MVRNGDNSFYVVNSRVANFVADHDSLLTQWRPIKMSKFRTNIFWYKLLPTTARPRDTRFFVPEKNRAAQNRASWGLYLCSKVIFFFKNRVASRLLSKIRALQVLLWTNSCAQETGLNGQYITLFVVEWDMITQWVEIISSIFLKRFFYFLHFHEILF